MLVMHSKSVTMSNTATAQIPTSKTRNIAMFIVIEAEKLNNKYKICSIMSIVDHKVNAFLKES